MPYAVGPIIVLPDGTMDDMSVIPDRFFDFVYRTTENKHDVLTHHLGCPIGVWYVIKWGLIVGPFDTEESAIKWRFDHPMTTHDEWRRINMLSHTEPDIPLVIYDPEKGDV